MTLLKRLSAPRPYEKFSMTHGIKIKINQVAYVVELVGPRTTLLLRGDGAYVHVDTSMLMAVIEHSKIEPEQMGIAA